MDARSYRAFSSDASAPVLPLSEVRPDDRTNAEPAASGPRRTSWWLLLLSGLRVARTFAVAHRSSVFRIDVLLIMFAILFFSDVMWYLGPSVRELIPSTPAAFKISTLDESATWFATQRNGDSTVDRNEKFPEVYRFRHLRCAYADMVEDEKHQDHIRQGRIPVVFVHGNAGSYDLASSLASLLPVGKWPPLSRKPVPGASMPALGMTVFAVDYAEEANIHSGATLVRQAKFLLRSVAFVKKRFSSYYSAVGGGGSVTTGTCDSNAMQAAKRDFELSATPLDARPSPDFCTAAVSEVRAVRKHGVWIVGHSMGGFVAKLAMVLQLLKATCSSSSDASSVRATNNSGQGSALVSGPTHGLIAGVITLNTPHQYPPVILGSDMVLLYDLVDFVWWTGAGANSDAPTCAQNRPCGNDSNTAPPSVTTPAQSSLDRIERLLGLGERTRRGKKPCQWKDMFVPQQASPSETSGMGQVNASQSPRARIVKRLPLLVSLHSGFADEQVFFMTTEPVSVRRLMRQRAAHIRTQLKYRVTSRLHSTTNDVASTAAVATRTTAAARPQDGEEERTLPIHVGTHQLLDCGILFDHNSLLWSLEFVEPFVESIWRLQSYLTTISSALPDDVDVGNGSPSPVHGYGRATKGLEKPQRARSAAAFFLAPSDVALASIVTEEGELSSDTEIPSAPGRLRHAVRLPVVHRRPTTLPLNRVVHRDPLWSSSSSSLSRFALAFLPLRAMRVAKFRVTSVPALSGSEERAQRMPATLLPVPLLLPHTSGETVEGSSRTLNEIPPTAAAEYKSWSLVLVPDLPPAVDFVDVEFRLYSDEEIEPETMPSPNATAVDGEPCNPSLLDDRHGDPCGPVRSCAVTRAPQSNRSTRSGGSSTNPVCRPISRGEDATGTPSPHEGLRNDPASPPPGAAVEADGGTAESMSKSTPTYPASLRGERPVGFEASSGFVTGFAEAALFATCSHGDLFTLRWEWRNTSAASAIHDDDVVRPAFCMLTVVPRSSASREQADDANSAHVGTSSVTLTAAIESEATSFVRLHRTARPLLWRAPATGTAYVLCSVTNVLVEPSRNIALRWANEMVVGEFGPVLLHVLVLFAGVRFLLDAVLPLQMLSTRTHVATFGPTSPALFSTTLALVLVAFRVAAGFPEATAVCKVTAVVAGSGLGTAVVRIGAVWAKVIVLGVHHSRSIPSKLGCHRLGLPSLASAPVAVHLLLHLSLWIALCWLVPEVFWPLLAAVGGPLVAALMLRQDPSSSSSGAAATAHPSLLEVLGSVCALHAATSGCALHVRNRMAMNIDVADVPLDEEHRLAAVVTLLFCAALGLSCRASSRARVDAWGWCLCSGKLVDVAFALLIAVLEASWKLPDPTLAHVRDDPALRQAMEWNVYWDPSLLVCSIAILPLHHLATSALA